MARLDKPATVERAFGLPSLFLDPKMGQMNSFVALYRDRLASIRVHGCEMSQNGSIATGASKRGLS
ncbi:hypothetical protein A0U93_05110 [Neoasaia chiangmaiensis]|uniref:Uncharacterized protein n=1 Tax=Neoasaia chiangmaiensis TaxID=320497 RepID=A0A1U9KNY5_9PROT|nr:hypothetical protein A0U93_05110 [Neoasaia chiangmaiensis]